MMINGTTDIMGLRNIIDHLVEHSGFDAEARKRKYCDLYLQNGKDFQTILKYSDAQFEYVHRTDELAFAAINKHLDSIMFELNGIMHNFIPKQKMTDVPSKDMFYSDDLNFLRAIISCYYTDKDKNKSKWFICIVYFLCMSFCILIKLNSSYVCCVTEWFYTFIF